MLKIELIKGKDIDDFTEIGQIDIGDKYPDICCKNYEWQVVYVYDSLSIWGECQNANCLIKKRDNCISRYGIDDIVDCLLSKQME